MDPTTAMRNFHTMMREKQMENTTDPEMIEKLAGICYLSALSLDTRTVDIPSNYLLPTLRPRELEEKKE